MIDMDVPVCTPHVALVAESSARPAGLRRFGPWIILSAAYVLVPLAVTPFWLQLLLLSGASAIAALGLRFLVGVSGQLSLAHAFFVGVGAYGYVKLGPHILGASTDSLGLPAPVAAVAAVALAGFCGLLFSPVAARLSGIYLGLASLALVSIGSATLAQVDSLGGVYGLQVPPLNLGSFNFWENNPSTVIFGMPLGTLPRLWFLVMLLLFLTFVALRRIERTRTGRALKTVRDSPSAAASSGIHVQSYRSLAFGISSLCAGLAGVLLALVYQTIVPDGFGLSLSILYLVMVVVGGPRSAVGSVVAALVVTGLPLVLSHYSADLPLVSQPGDSGGVDAGTASQYAFGLAMILVLLSRRRRPQLALVAGRRARKLSREATASHT